MIEYHVWAFRKHQDCYDCGSVEKIDVELNTSAVAMDEETFHTFLKGVQREGTYSYVYLYRRTDDNALQDHVKNVIESGRSIIEEEKKRVEEQKRKEVEKAARAKESAAKKAAKEAEKVAEQERMLYEKLKEKFEK